MMRTHPALAAMVVLGFALFVFWRARRDYSSRCRLTVFTTVLQFLVFLLHGLAYYSFVDDTGSFGPVNSALRPVAVALMVLGLVVVFGAMAQLSMGDTVGRSVRGLRSTGFYRFSRNPQLIAYFLFLAGYGLLKPVWQVVGWLALYVMIAHVMVLTEEAHLRRTCGNAFQDYCRNTRRYLGWRIRDRMS